MRGHSPVPSCRWDRKWVCSKVSQGSTAAPWDFRSQRQSSESCFQLGDGQEAPLLPMWGIWSLSGSSSCGRMRTRDKREAGISSPSLGPSCWTTWTIWLLSQTQLLWVEHVRRALTGTPGPVSGWTVSDCFSLMCCCRVVGGVGALPTVGCQESHLWDIAGVSESEERVAESATGSFVPWWRGPGLFPHSLLGAGRALGNPAVLDHREHDTGLPLGLLAAGAMRIKGSLKGWRGVVGTCGSAGVGECSVSCTVVSLGAGLPS